mmetsp:Transcript_10106/g.30410  ORF Transcript_10106/g.30410 Transcript_10106/m.30410 type:complete len:200 (-) Transcript_10106:396-995(-)
MTRRTCGLSTSRSCSRSSSAASPPSAGAASGSREGGCWVAPRRCGLSSWSSSCTCRLTRAPAPAGMASARCARRCASSCSPARCPRRPATHRAADLHTASAVNRRARPRPRGCRRDVCRRLARRCGGGGGLEERVRRWRRGALAALLRSHGGRFLAARAGRGVGRRPRPKWRGHGVRRRRGGSWLGPSRDPVCRRPAAV